MGPDPKLEEAERDARQMARKLCKSNVVSVVTKKDEKTGVSYHVVAEGCRNERRDGSAWCQACSDAHRAAHPA
jgi:hypothetical protein